MASLLHPCLYSHCVHDIYRVLLSHWPVVRRGDAGSSISTSPEAEEEGISTSPKCKQSDCIVE
ncbi:hypothetical protein C0J52_12492 [Blattella germanica]|nr:hypothetical protein C0J52_12492 [Blattella germanica]